MSFNSKHRLSFEFFPPKTSAGVEKLKLTSAALSSFKPEFFSVTYGAGGSTRDNTKAIVLDGIAQGLSMAPHLSFGGDDKGQIKNLLAEYIAAGVKRIVALRGDLPSGYGDGARLVHANELVAFIRSEFGEALELEVAAYPEIHPESDSYQNDIGYLKKKFDAGANSAITQYFFNPDAYAWFMEACQTAGINQPIFPGVMPIINFENLKRFSANCGAEIPRWLTYRIDSLSGDEQGSKDFCADFVSRLCERLLELGAPGIHFYTMNQIQPVAAICENLGIKRG
jgi:methylenetetrahydrofolate reductase (NADPH)